MLVTFKSDADADIFMYRKHAEPIVQLLGKDVERGILTLEELPQAIAKLEAAIEADRRAHPGMDEAEEEKAKEEGKDVPVEFHRRAWPLLQMMKRSLAEKKPVVWGV
ncbi:MAG: DUF1840 domain-containing protein [Rhodocyclales bacterium]|nr:DUF1840 domain-containing protein [Rhodocyclales bacterium]